MYQRKRGNTLFTENGNDMKQGDKYMIEPNVKNMYNKQIVCKRGEKELYPSV